MRRKRLGLSRYKWWRWPRGCWLNFNGTTKLPNQLVEIDPEEGRFMFSDVRMASWAEGVQGWKGEEMEVREDQIWEDLDTRMWTRKEGRRQVVVLRVDENYAYVQGVVNGRHTRIRLNRMRPIHNGFKYVGSHNVEKVL